MLKAQVYFNIPVVPTPSISPSHRWHMELQQSKASRQEQAAMTQLEEMMLGRRDRNRAAWRMRMPWVLLQKGSVENFGTLYGDFLKKSKNSREE